MDRGAIEQLSRRHKLSQWIEELSRSYRDCDKKKLKSSIDKLGIESVEELSRLLKNSFSRKKNTNMNAIKHATQPMIQSTF